MPRRMSRRGMEPLSYKGMPVVETDELCSRTAIGATNAQVPDP